MTRSPLAEMANHPQDVNNRTADVFGVVVHTTGGGVLEKAKKLGIDPLEAAVAIYTTPGANFAHYVIGHDGTIIQIADEQERAPHAGVGSLDRSLYVSGAWRAKVSPAALSLWFARWPGRQHPIQFFPGASVNNVYLGVEMIPLLDRTFSEEQYDALGNLMLDVQTRHGLLLQGTRLVGHEDLEPLTRWDAKGGWDPGALRPQPRFLWKELRSRMGNNVA